MKCLYPGSFDPVTLGHMDLIRRAAGLFDEVDVALLHNPDKQGLFSVPERVEMLKECCAAMANVKIVSFEGLLCDLARETGIRLVIRGVRGIGDMDGEAAMARINRALNPEVETVLFPASPEWMDVSSSMVRQIAAFQGDIAPFVPEAVAVRVREKMKGMCEGGSPCRKD